MHKTLDWLQAQGIAPLPNYIRDRSHASSAATPTPGQSSAQRPISPERRRSGSQSSEAEVKQELIEPEPGERLAALQVSDHKRQIDTDIADTRSYSSNITQSQMKQIQDEINKVQEITKRSWTETSTSAGRTVPRRNERWATSSAAASRQRDGVFDLTSDN